MTSIVASFWAWQDLIIVLDGKELLVNQAKPWWLNADGTSQSTDSTAHTCHDAIVLHVFEFVQDGKTLKILQCSIECKGDWHKDLHRHTLHASKIEVEITYPKACNDDQ